MQVNAKQSNSTNHITVYERESLVPAFHLTIYTLNSGEAIP